MNIREAILAAADHIERNPGAYNYQSNSKPSCNSPGCLMGWIGFFAGVEEAEYGYMGDVCSAVGFDYCDILRFTFAMPDDAYMQLGGLYTKSAPVAAKVLRLYADKYHPAPAYDGLQLVSWENSVWRPKQVRV